MCNKNKFVIRVTHVNWKYTYEGWREYYEGSDVKNNVGRMNEC